MTLVAVDVRRLDLRLSEPYTIAYDTYDHTTNFLVRLQDADGEHGQGCAAPAPEVTGETAEACEEALRRAADLLTRRPTPAASRSCVDAVATPAAAAAIDMAIHDLRARRIGVPLGEMLGMPLPSARTSITIGIMPTEEMVATALRHTAAGFTALKVKGGLDRIADADRLMRLRTALGPDVELRFDANQGYSVEDALKLANDIVAADVAMLEQPTPASAPAALGEITRAFRAMRRAGRPAPLVMADESAVDLLSSVRLVLADQVEALNIKLMKVGGIAQAVALDRVARTALVPTMISCMDEAAISIAAGLHLALASRNVRWVDLDGHLDLVDDPSAGTVVLTSGELAPTSGPGLGCADLG